MGFSPTEELTGAPVFPVGGILDPPTGGADSGCEAADHAGVAGKVALVQRRDLRALVLQRRPRPVRHQRPATASPTSTATAAAGAATATASTASRPLNHPSRGSDPLEG